MTLPPRLLLRLAVVALVAALGSFLIPVKRPKSDYVPPPMPQVAPPEDGSVFTPPAAPTPEEIKTAAAFTPEFPDFNGGPAILPALPLQKGELPWEAQLRGVIEAEGLPPAQRADMLLKLMPTLSVEGRETATEEAVKILPNSGYRVARDVIINPGTYGPALNVLFADLMERPREISLPTLLQIARIQQHPFAPNARDNLQLLLGQDFGADWNRWDAAIRAALAAKQ